MRAAGSLDKKALVLTERQKFWRTLEMLLIYCGVPILMTYAVYGFGVSLIVILQPILLILVLWLWLDPAFSLKIELTRGFDFKTLLDILLHFFFIGGALTILVGLMWPEIFFGFPQAQPDIWRIVMIGYPILSVIPQELVYRTLFFHRYGPLFDDGAKLAVFANSLFFGFAHIVMANPVAVAGTMLISLLFARRYLRSGSLWATWLEHSLYGCLIFTLGLGIYFYTGSTHLN